MNTKKFWIVALAMVFIYVTCGNAMSACSSLTCSGYIQRLYSDSAGNLYIATDGDERNLNCTSPANVYIVLPGTDPNFDRKYALLLTAFAMERPLTLRIVENSANCALSYIVMDK